MFHNQTFFTQILPYDYESDNAQSPFMLFDNADLGSTSTSFTIYIKTKQGSDFMGNNHQAFLGDGYKHWLVVLFPTIITRTVYSSSFKRIYKLTIFHLKNI